MLRHALGAAPVQAQPQRSRRVHGARPAVPLACAFQRAAAPARLAADAGNGQPAALRDCLAAASPRAAQGLRVDRSSGFLCQASASDSSSAASAQHPSTARELLSEYGVPDTRIDITLEAARHAIATPAEDRPLLQFSEDGSPVEKVEGSAPAPIAPWDASSQREGWLADARAKFAFLSELGIARDKVGSVVALSPHLLAHPLDDLRKAAAFLQSLGLEPPQLAAAVAAAPRLLCFSVADHLQPAVEYLEGAGIARPMLLNLFCTQPAFVLSAVEHKVVTDKAASLIKAAYLVQNEQRVEYALQLASDIRTSLKQSSGFSWG